MADEPGMVEDPDGLVPGRRYRVEFDDCCAVGSVAAGVFQRWAPSDDGSVERDAAVFDALTIGPEWSFGRAWRCFEVE